MAALPPHRAILGLTAAPSLFMRLTCRRGRGDVVHAVAVLVTGRALRLEAPGTVRRVVLVVALVALALNWAAKLDRLAI